jgi:hypothetical protein
VPYRKADAGFLLDLQIENEVSILCGLRSRGQAPPYSTSVEVARTLLPLLAADSENVDIEELGGEWECPLTSCKGVITDVGDTEALAICAGFMAAIFREQRLLDGPVRLA